MSKIGRNNPCPCGSGKKYKKCCLKNMRLNRDLEKLGDIAEAVSFDGYFGDEDVKFVISMEEASSSGKVKSLCEALLSYPMNSRDLTADDYMAISASMASRERAGFYECCALFNDLSENTDVAEILYDESIDLYGKLGDHYDKARVLIKKALVQFDLGRHGAAIALLKESMEIGDTEGRAGCLLNMGLVYSEMGDYKAALSCYQKALGAFDRLGNAEQKRNIYRGMVAAYQMLGDEGSAQVYVDELGIEDTDIDREEERLLLKIKHLVERGKIDRAIETYIENPDLLSKMAGALAGMDHVMAEKFLRRMVESFPGHGKSHYNLGLYLRENGEMEEAEKEYRHCMELDPTYLDAYINLGNILHMTGRFEEAERILTKGLGLGEDPLLFHALGNVYADTGRFDEAERMYKRAMGMGYSFSGYSLKALKEKRAGGGKPSPPDRHIWVSTSPESRENSDEMTKREFAQFMGFKNLGEYEKEAMKIQRKLWESFVDFFGGDELICGNGEELADRLDEFYYWHSHERKDEAGKTPAQRWVEEKGTPAPVLNVRESFPEELLEEVDVAMILDEFEGQHILVDYGKFSMAFSEPDVYIDEFREIVEDYLLDEDAPPLVFFRMAERYPENTQRVLREVLERPDFNLNKLEDLMCEFKPKAMEHR
ncbi:MAG: tetratricopeptide repeat protein, partial [Candidatus Hydrothermarchaeaceae archaeon]